MRLDRFAILYFGILMASAVEAAVYYGPHITAQPPWINRIDVYNNENAPRAFSLTIWDSQGQLVLIENYAVGANAVTSVVLPADPDYVPAAGEIVLPAVEGTCTVTADSTRVRPKLSFRYGDSLSLCEFFMQETLAWEYVLPNTIQAHFIGTGLAIQNPFETTLSVRLQAFRQGEPVGDTGPLIIEPHAKLVSISEGFWPGVGVGDFDMVRISSYQSAFPTPMSITWNQFNDRHVFLNAAPTALSQTPQPGDMLEMDSIVGSLKYVPAGNFIQGSPRTEPCRHYENEEQFPQICDRAMLVMATEVTRQMWAELRAVQPSLPSDPTCTLYGAGMNNPVQNITWYEAVLFANLLSDERGLTSCYYKDASFSQAVTIENYNGGDFYWKQDANGYRLLSESEWEYSCRAGASGPFWIQELNYNDHNCDLHCTPGMMPSLESVAWFSGNKMSPEGLDTTKPVGMKLPNPWGLYDVHGNVDELCWDCFDPYPPMNDYENMDGTISSGCDKVGRGGCWGSDPYMCRSAARNGMPPDAREPALGFRLARSLP